MQLPARCAQTVDSNDREALAGCFTEDAVLRVEVPEPGRLRSIAKRRARARAFETMPVEGMQDSRTTGRL
jgi:hypothetical protein